MADDGGYREFQMQQVIDALGEVFVRLQKENILFSELEADAKRYHAIRRLIRDGVDPFDAIYVAECDIDAAVDKALKNECKGVGGRNES